MRYIKKREQYLIIENQKDVIYDGTWEDTFIGMFFGYIGKKIKDQTGKKSMNLLLNQLRRELEKAQFKTIIDEPVVQKFDIYGNIVLLKSFIKNSDFDQKELEEKIEDSIEYHKEQSSNNELPLDIRKEHIKVVSGMQELLQYSKSISLTNESMIFEGKDENIDIIRDLFHNYMNSPLQKGGTDTLMTVDIGTESRYNQYKDLIKDKLNSFRNHIENSPYVEIGNDQLSNSIKNFYNYIGSSGFPERGKMNWDNHGALRASLVKVRKEMERISGELDNMVESEINVTGSNIGNYKELMNKKIDEIFPNDKEYVDKVKISDSDMSNLHKIMKTKVENQKHVVDPITILRIFNRAYNSYTINKEEYESFNDRFSPKVARRKQREYELMDTTARRKDLFNAWNDGVLNLLQQYGDYISKSTKKFIIEILDNNKLFRDKGAQSKLLHDYFDIPLEDSKSKLKDIKKPGEHKIRLTEDNVIRFQEVKNVEMNSDKIRRVPFILEVVNEMGERKKVTLYPLNANKGVGNSPSSISVKYTQGNDYGFIKNYMSGINVKLDSSNLTDMGMIDDDNSPVFYAEILSDNGFIEKSNDYKITNIKRLKDDEGFDDIKIRVDQIYMLLGSKDEGIYRLPPLNDSMKKSINDSPNDKLIQL